MSKNRYRILHLARWYPNRLDPMPGLFIKRHAEATALYHDVAVVYAHGLQKELLKSRFEKDISHVNGVETAKIYYQKSTSSFLFKARILNTFRYFKAVNIGIKAVSNSQKHFDLIHVHVLTRLGTWGLFYKWKKGVPFVITEHWTRYLNHSNDFNGVLRKWMTKRIVKNAAFVTTVSHDLTNAMLKHGLNNPAYKEIYNVVDSSFFDVKKTVESLSTTEFVHVSCFTDKHKNISGLLRIIKRLTNERNDFHFSLIGDGDDFQKIKNYSETLGINDSIIKFTGLLEGQKLAETMSAADALVIFSNYENMPVVINESLSLGIPVFSTDVGGISEIITKDNGRLVPKGDEDAMYRVLKSFLDKEIIFDNNMLEKKYKNAFSPNAVGLQLTDLYKMALRKK